MTSEDNTNPLSNITSSLKDVEKKKACIKVGMLGDSAIGKTTLMSKFVEGKFQEDYIETLGVNFMEKNISCRNTDISFIMWDLGGQKEYQHMMELVCNGADVIFFMFDLTNKLSLNGVKDWYKEARKINKTAIPFLIGTKFDIFFRKETSYKNDVIKLSQQFSKAMKSPLIFCSATHSINIKNIFKIVISKMFNVKCDVKQDNDNDAPILQY